ncbi:MAG: ParA family protein [Blastocatellia bacterium]|nr:ParA family protein [Blastocatellia bacterium]
MIIITIANQKGGVGKSTSTAMLGCELALRKYKTLLIDADPQGNLSEIFLDISLIKTSLANSLIGDKNLPLETQILSTEIENLDLVPSTISLANFDREPPLSVTKLRTKLREISSLYDFVLIDTPPNLGLLLTAALTASDKVVVPVQAAPLALSGLRDLLDVVEKAKEINEKLEFLGAICTMFDSRTAISSASYNALVEALPDKIFNTIINRSSKLEEAPATHQPIQLYAPNTRATEQYQKLGEEILKSLGLQKKKVKQKEEIFDVEIVKSYEKSCRNSFKRFAETSSK